MSDQSPDLVRLDEFIDKYVVATVKNFKNVSDKYVYLFAEILGRMSFDIGGEKYLIRRDAVDALKNFSIALEERDFSFLFTPRGLRVDRVVDVQEFAESRYYLGLKGTIKPKILEHLWNIFHSEYSEYYMEVVVGGAIGIGKSFLAKVGTAYILYRLSCFHSPQLEYGLAPGSNIVFTFQSLRLDQAKKVLFDQFAEWVRNSPYFIENFSPDPYSTTELRFPSNIKVLPLSSSDTAALGYDVYSAILDELNFMAKVEDSVRVGEQGGEYDQAERLYASVMRRMKSRFQHHGKVPGKVFLCSSANYRGDFIDRKRKEYESIVESGGIPNMYVVWMSQWEARGRDDFSDEVFYVEVGDETKQSRIIKSKDEAINPDDVIEVPMDFYDDFVRDLDAALRDLAGIPTGSVGTFFRHRGSIENAMVMHSELFGGEQLFITDRVDTGYMPPIYELFNTNYIKNYMRAGIVELFSKGGDEDVHNVDDDSGDSYASDIVSDSDMADSFITVHVDLGLVHDSCGIAVSRYAGSVNVKRGTRWDESNRKFVEADGDYPVVIVDGVIELVPPPSDDIDIHIINQILECLITNFNVAWVTTDSFQSAYILQFVRKLRNASGDAVRTAVVSPDQTIAPYSELKHALRDGRVIMPRCDKLKRELVELQYDARRNKIDHPRGGSKDISDAVACSSYVIFNLFGPGKRNVRLSRSRGKVRRKVKGRRPSSSRRGYRRRRVLTRVR